MSSTFGLNPYDLKLVRKKIFNQEQYLKSNKFITESGEQKTLLDVSYSANLSKRYYPRILNKVDTFVSHALSLGNVPIFLTVTLDGFFRDFMRGDFSKWTKKLRDQYLKFIPNNKRNGQYLDQIDQHKKLTPKDLYKILSHQLHRFNMSESLRSIRKDGFKYSYIRVTEPHKDGVPHFHILMYLPAFYIADVYKDFLRFFPAPRNHKRITKKNTIGDFARNGAFIYKSAAGIKYYESFGFQTEIENASSYILKYILKSFTNLIKGNKIDYLQAWYIHNRIPRLITTHTLISQDIFHKISPLEPDWYYLTDLKHNGNFINFPDQNYFRFDDGKGRILVGDSGLYYIMNNGKIVSQYGAKTLPPVPHIRLRSLDFSLNRWYAVISSYALPKGYNPLRVYNIWHPPKKYSYFALTTFKDGSSFTFVDVNDFSLTFTDYTTDVIDGHPFISSYSDINLLHHYNTFDFDEYYPARYAVIHNELIDRGLLRENYVNPNNYNIGFYND